MSARPGGAGRRAAMVLVLGLMAALAGCDRAAAPAPAVSTSGTPGGALRILAGSELKELAPALQQAAEQAGVPVRFEFAGSLDIVDRANAAPDAAGRGFDAILPAGGAYPALALRTPPLARERLFYARIALGVKTTRWRELGWDRQNPGWAQVAAAVKAGRLRYAMTNPTSSNSGMSALFAVAAAAAGKTEDLTLADVRAPAAEATVRAFLAGQKLTAGSSGWLADAYVRDQDTLDAMVNYESVILRLNDPGGGAPKLKDPLVPVYPSDGVISADYPLMLLAPADAALRARFDRVVEAWRAPAVQGPALAAAYLRPSSPDVKAAAALPGAAVVELAFPNRLEVIDAVLGAWLGEWRRPATAIFVLDTSGSMGGARIDGLRRTLQRLAGAESDASLAARFTRFQPREHVVVIPFSTEPRASTRFEYDSGPPGPVSARLRDYADALQPDGGTAIYSALVDALDAARAEQKAHPERLVSIVLLTDGLNNAGVTAADFERALQAGTPVRIFPIVFGEASSTEMARIAEVSGGRVFDARSADLGAVFKDIRGYQ